jgi:hypothetical protein
MSQLKEEQLLASESINEESSSILRIVNLNVYADKHHILKNINLDIPKIK